jgi:hypothetical protein
VDGLYGRPEDGKTFSRRIRAGHWPVRLPWAAQGVGEEPEGPDGGGGEAEEPPATTA